MMRWRRAPRWPRATRGSSASSSARPTRISAQSVRGTRVVQLDRRRNATRDEAGVVSKFGVPPASIPDYLALVGDAADGYPGLRGWGPKSTAAVLAKFGHLEAIPEDSRAWQVNAANAATLAATFVARARAGVAVPRSGDAPVRHPALRVGRRARVARADAGVRAAGDAGSTRPRPDGYGIFVAF